MKKLTFVLFICIVSFLFFNADCGCGNNNAESQQSEETDKILGEINREIGMPNISKFTQKKLFKMILELCDLPDLVTYTYILDYNGNFHYVTKSIGYGLPFSAQYTNPQKYYYNGVALPQADPNGLYMPTSSDATWLITVHHQTNKIKVVYMEPKISVWPYPIPNAIYPNIEGLRFKDLIEKAEKE